MTAEERLRDELGDWKATFNDRTAGEVCNMLGESRKQRDEMRQRAEKVERERNEACEYASQVERERDEARAAYWRLVGAAAHYLNMTCADPCDPGRKGGYMPPANRTADEITNSERELRAAIAAADHGKPLLDRLAKLETLANEAKPIIEEMTGRLERLQSEMIRLRDVVGEVDVALIDEALKEP